MNAVDIAVIVVVAVAFVAAAGLIIYKKLKHKGGCDCGCDGCSACSKCHPKDKK